MGYPTQFQEVNTLLEALRQGVQQILGTQLTGMYLFGSLTSGDFDADSDVDVLIVTANPVDDRTFNALYAMHLDLSKMANPWADQLEVSYIPQAHLRRYDPAHANHPHLDRDPGETLHWKQHGVDWIIQRQALRLRGIVIDGPALTTLIDPVPAEVIRQANRDMLAAWAPEFDTVPEWIRRRGGQSYTVLTMCRVLYSLSLGEPVSKPAASRWALTALDPRWKPLIEGAWVGRHHPDTPAEPGDLAETVAFVRYVVEMSRTF
jgi:predicted nucleotidyltransferase